LPWESKRTAHVKTKTNPIDGAEMVFIPGGEFMMGTNRPVLARLPSGLLDRIPWMAEGIRERALAYEDASPRHRVVVDGFWMYTYEVTNEQYREFEEASGRREPAFWDRDGWDQPRQPVVGVNWHDAAAYCEWPGVRLPTEAEWEYAARGDMQYDYATATGKLSHDLANIKGTEGKDKWAHTSPVGRFPANPFGLHDMCGNVWDWCSSLYKSYPYRADDGREDLKDKAGERVFRGGSWHSGSAVVRCAYRDWTLPGDGDWRFGFRCAR